MTEAVAFLAGSLCGVLAALAAVFALITACYAWAQHQGARANAAAMASVERAKDGAPAPARITTTESESA